MTGRSAFVWHARLKPIGIPLVIVAAARRSTGTNGLGAACRSAALVFGLALIEAELEFLWHRNRWRRSRGAVW